MRMVAQGGWWLCLLVSAGCWCGAAGQQMGQASGTAQQAQFDAEHRPITAGGFVKSGPVIFEDVAAHAGLTGWHNTTGTAEKKVIIEAKGSGVCLLDYDRDGWLDIYLVTGSTFDARSGKAEPPHAALFRNNHDGTFTDVTAKAGVANDRWGLGCAVGDFDNDGWPDLYVTNVGSNRLYHNNGERHVYGCGGEGGSDAGERIAGPGGGSHGGDVRRLRRRRAAGFVCGGICPLRLRASAGIGIEGGGGIDVPVSRGERDVRAARAGWERGITCSTTTAMGRLPM